MYFVEITLICCKVVNIMVLFNFTFLNECRTFIFQNTFQLLQLLVQPPVDTTTSSPHFQYQLQTLDES